MELDVSRAREQYGRQAEHYTRSVVHASGETLQLVTDWSQPQPQQVALDIATGAGFTAFELAPHLAKVVSYDLTPEMLGHARIIGGQRGLMNVEFVQGVAEQLPFQDDCFDIVVCRTAPHHFQSVESFVRESRRVARRRGLVLVVDTSVPGHPEIDEWQNRVELMRDPSHVRNLSLKEWEVLFKAHDLEVTNTSLRYRTPLVFSDWVVRSGTPPKVVEELRGLFLGASDKIKETFQIKEGDGDIYFAWLVAALSGRKIGA